MEKPNNNDETPANQNIWARFSIWARRKYARYLDNRANAFKDRARKKLALLIKQHKQELATVFPTDEAVNAKASAIVGDWHQLEALEHTLGLDTHATLKHTLEDILIDHVQSSDKWEVTRALERDLEQKVVPVPEVLRALKIAAATAVLDKHEALKSEFRTVVQITQTDFEKGLKKLSLSSDQISARVTAFNGEVDTIVADLNTLPDDADTRKATDRLQQAVSDAYDAVQAQFLQDFRENDMPLFLGSVWNEKIAPIMVADVFMNKKSIDLVDINPRYPTSHPHLLDQLVNNMACQCGPDGSLYFKARSFEDGGMFDFEHAWMKIEANFRKKLKDSKKARLLQQQELAQIAAPASEHMYFVDQISVPNGVQDVLQNGIDISLERASPAESSLLAFAAKVRRLELSPDELRIHKFEGLSQYHGLSILKNWVQRNAARGLFAQVSADGMIYLVLRNEHSGADKQISRADDNTLRMMALLMVAVIERAVNGAESARALPRNLKRSVGLDIPPHCIWPLQICRQDKQATLLETGSALAKALPMHAWIPAPLENWMLGWNQLPEPNQILQDALAKRYQITTEQQVQILQAPDEVGGRGVGLDTKSTLERLMRWFQYTSFFLCAVWLVTVVLTIWFGERYAYWELWLISALFFAIGLSRFFLVRTMLQAERGPALRSKRSEAWARRQRGVLSLMLGHKSGLLIGPALLVAFGIYIFLTGPHFGPADLPVEALLDSIGLDPLADDAFSFRSVMQASVWTLPILTLGLLRQAFVMLSELLADRSQIKRRLSTLRALETNWHIGTAAGSAEMQEAAKPLTQSITRLKEKLEAKRAKAGRIFGEKSAANAAMITLASILSTWGSLEPKQANESAEELAALNAIQKRYAGPTATTPFDHDLRLASLSPLSPMPVNSSNKFEADTCAALRLSDWSKIAQKEMTSARQALLIVSLMDCVESTARHQAQSLGAVKEEIEHQTTSLVTAAKELEAAFRDGSPGTQKTYVCLFGFGKHCVQDSRVNVALPEIGKVAFDPESFATQLAQAADALERLKGPHTATLRLNTLPLADGIAATHDALNGVAKTPPITLNANIASAIATLETLEDKLAQITGVHHGEVRIKAGDAYETYGRVLAQRRTLAEPLEIKPTVEATQATKDLMALQTLKDTLTRNRQILLTANAGQIYQEVGMARTALEALPQRRHVLLRGIWDRPLIDIDISLPQVPSASVSPLQGCRRLAARYFDINRPRIRDSLPEFNIWDHEKWTFDGHGNALSDDQVKTWLKEMLEDGKFVYVLGVTDVLGAPEYNLGLSQRRSDHVKKALLSLETGSNIVALTIGEHGWLTAPGLPKSEGDGAHRKATIMGCGAPLN